MFDFFEAFTEREYYARWLQSERKMRKPAADRQMQECVKCGLCCVGRTCVPTPDELPTIAEFLGLTVAELVKQYMVGDRIDGHCFLRFANSEQDDILGTFLSWRRSYDRGMCLLFKDGDCSIWPVRPIDARQTNCWEPHDDTKAHSSINQWAEGKMEQLGVAEKDDTDWWYDDGGEEEDDAEEE